MDAVFVPDLSEITIRITEGRTCLVSHVQSGTGINTHFYSTQPVLTIYTWNSTVDILDSMDVFTDSYTLAIVASCGESPVCP